MNELIDRDAVMSLRDQLRRADPGLTFDRVEAAVPTTSSAECRSSPTGCHDPADYESRCALSAARLTR